MQQFSTPKIDITDLRVSVVYWQEGDGIARVVSRSLENLGIETINFIHDARLPSNLDVVISRGPFGSIVPLANQLIACPASHRPAFVFWMSEWYATEAILKPLKFGFQERGLHASLAQYSKIL